MNVPETPRASSSGERRHPPMITACLAHAMKIKPLGVCGVLEKRRVGMTSLPRHAGGGHG